MKTLFRTFGMLLTLGGYCTAQELSLTPDRILAILPSSNDLSCISSDFVLSSRKDIQPTVLSSTDGKIADETYIWISTNKNLDVRIRFLAFSTSERLLAELNKSQEASNIKPSRKPLTIEDIHSRNWFVETVVSPLQHGSAMKSHDVQIAISVMIERKFISVLLSQVGKLRTPPYRGRLVRSTSTISPEKISILKGAPVTNTLISLIIVVAPRKFMSDPPSLLPCYQSFYYTFTDTNGLFNIPSLSETYTNPVGPEITVEAIPQRFSVFGTDGNVRIEKGIDTIFPFSMAYPSDPLNKSLEILSNYQAKPVHPGDKAKYESMCRQMKINTNKVQQDTR